MPDLLLEVGTEELPASYIRPALTQMARAVCSTLEDARLVCGRPRTAGTPRRLAVWLPDIPARQADVEVELTGPPAKVAFDNSGRPTRAAMGFARAHGLTVDDVVRVQTPKGEYCAVRKSESGRAAADILADMIPRVLEGVGFPKSMRWPEAAPAFGRPIRWLVALLGEEVVPCDSFGVSSGRVTEGHPFLAPGELTIASADWEAYKERLRQARVVVDMDERRAEIRAQIDAALAEFGGKMQEEWLLEEVVGLVQCPQVLVGRFAEEFLAVPSAAVVSAMTEHQRYFPVRDAGGSLCPSFLVVSDRGDIGVETIRRGNERVLHARLSDARFFYEQDRARCLADYVPATEGRVFLKGLGNYRDKTQRLALLVKSVCEALGYDETVGAVAARAALLCKADLVTAMVGEFAKLQGVMGGIYADEDQEPAGVGTAVAEHYLPRAAEDGLPGTDAGRALSLAEKLDNLCGCFSLGLVPSGSQDPYALRRQSQAILRMAEESGRFFGLGELVRSALDLLPAQADKSAETHAKALGFLRDRLQQLALDRSVPHDLVQAALAVDAERVTDFWLRLNALSALSAEPVWTGLVAVVERTHNISREAPDGEVNADLFSQDEERALWETYGAQRDVILGLQAERKYADAARRYAGAFSQPVHRFFESVFVNVDDSALRVNRLRLVKAVHLLFAEKVADLSLITTGIP